MSDFDTPENRAIVAAGIGLVGKWRSLGIINSPEGWTECRALEAAVIKREQAERPKLLTAEEAATLYTRAGGWSDDNKNMQAVLTAAFASALKVTLFAVTAIGVDNNGRVHPRAIEEAITRALTPGERP